MPRTDGNQLKPKKDCFTWTDVDEVELLLKVANEYKVQKSTESVDWESVQSNMATSWICFKQNILTAKMQLL